jgi:hypothetical protein
LAPLALKMAELCAPLTNIRRSTSVGAVLDWDNLTRHQCYKGVKGWPCAKSWSQYYDLV